MYIITTKDGSHSLFSEQYEEIYHSGNGAIQESTHVFIRAGFDYAIQKFQPLDQAENRLKIFEVGFGTGLNALLTLIEAQKLQVPVYYETIERHPVSIELVKELNYTLLLENEKYRPPFHSMHLSNWNTEHSITPYFSFKKNEGSFLDIQPLPDTFHLVFEDSYTLI